MKPTLSKLLIGVLTLPINENTEEYDAVTVSQYFLTTNTTFLQASGDATVVPVRYDLINHPEVLKQTLDSLDGVYFTGGMLTTKQHSKMTAATRTFQQTAKEIVRYCMLNRLPLLGICQGFQLICQLVIELFEPFPDGIS
jgi:gamma-glutamyl-gamma-aminobutyrate hydrolase PuuD